MGRALRKRAGAAVSEGRGGTQADASLQTAAPGSGAPGSAPLSHPPGGLRGPRVALPGPGEGRPGRRVPIRPPEGSGMPGERQEGTCWGLRCRRSRRFFPSPASPGLRTKRSDARNLSPGRAMCWQENARCASITRQGGFPVARRESFVATRFWPENCRFRTRGKGRGGEEETRQSME